jgi:3-deoxy-manno-octulosonate cytidylyltransferase (CMP-KDO synthetase)
LPLRVLTVIPARYASLRLPGKPLADIHGKPMIQHVYENASAATSGGQVVVATDDRRIYDAVVAFGGKAVMTSETHRSGTDRTAEVAAESDAGIIVNVQGDEPLIEPQMIDDVIAALVLDERAKMSTLASEILDESEYLSPDVVKVVANRWGSAMYFSRAPIPHYFDRPPHFGREAYSAVLKHIGIYAFRRDFLFKFATSRQGHLEKIERLEQLRALEFGHRIKVVRTKHPTISVDTEADIEKVRIILEGTIHR